MVTVRITIVILKTILTPKFLSKYYAKVLQSKSYKQNLDSFCYQTVAALHPRPASPEWPTLTYIPVYSQVPIGMGILVFVSPLYPVIPASSWAVIVTRDEQVGTEGWGFDLVIDAAFSTHALSWKVSYAWHGLCA